VVAWTASSESGLLVATLASSELVLVSVGVSVVVPPSAYAIVGPTALKTKTAMIVNERNDARSLSDIDPPYKKIDKSKTHPSSIKLYRLDFSESTHKRLQFQVGKGGQDKKGQDGRTFFSKIRQHMHAIQ
jgi:hypothetical protein